MAYRLLVEGRVQGVNYRSSVKRIADSMGVKGFVKNLEDGRVEIICDCDENTLEKFKQKIFLTSSSFIGPNVEKITEESFTENKSFSGFKIEF